MQLCTVTAQFSLKWQIVRHPKCCVQQIGQNQLRRNICHRYYWSNSGPKREKKYFDRKVEAVRRRLCTFIRYTK